MTPDTAKAIDALHAIPPDIDRDSWVKVAMGAHAAGVDFDTFDAWSAGAGNYDAAAARDVWRSIKPGKGVGAGTLYRVAAEHGWRMGEGKPQQRPMVYAALEGEAGFKLRAQAWEVSRGRALPDGLRMMLQPFKLTDGQDVLDLAAVVPAGAVVVLDTLNRSAPTADENSSRDMGEILEAAKTLQTLTRGLVLLVHHTGKNAAAGLRGHSSLFAAMDAAIEVSREGDRREWKVAKSKDGQDGTAQRPA